MIHSQNLEKKTFDIAIIGAGFAGLGAAIRLKMKGEESLIIFEKASELGGTWRDNTYPGCGCDIPSLLYSYSFELNPNWSRAFSRQGEILTYMKDCANKWKINPHIRFNREINRANFNAEEGHWEIEDKSGDIFYAKLLISAVGPFNAPFIPNIKGKDSFAGAAFHSLNWDHNYNLKGKKVAVIGTGASAIQFVPEIASEVEKLYIFQRSAPYINPKPDKPFTETAKKQFAKYPWWQRFWRELIYWILELQGRALFSDNLIRTRRKKIALKHLENSIPDSELRAQLTPNYQIGCKRILISDDYYPTLLKENVELVPEAVSEISEHAALTQSGKNYEVDLIIYATGFYATEFPRLFEVTGLSGKNIFDIFNDTGPEAYLGTAVADYPNFLFMVGPNSGLGHNSIIHMMESQINYMLSYLDFLRSTNHPNAYLNLKESVQKSFNEEIQARLSKMVWSEGGCRSYYLKDRDGKNTSMWPGSTATYRKRTKKVNKEDYEVMIPKQEL